MKRRKTGVDRAVGVSSDPESLSPAARAWVVRLVEENTAVATAAATAEQRAAADDAARAAREGETAAQAALSPRRAALTPTRMTLTAGGDAAASPPSDLVDGDGCARPIPAAWEIAADVASAAVCDRQRWRGAQTTARVYWLRFNPEAARSALPGSPPPP